MEYTPVSVSHGIAHAQWSGRVQGPWGGSRHLPSPQEESSFIGTVPSPERPQPGRKKRQGFLSARGITPCSPHQDPLSGHLSGDPPPQLSLQGQGLPEARGRGLPLPPPRQWGRRRSHESSLSGPPLGGRTLAPTDEGVQAERVEGSAEGLGQKGTRGSPSVGALGGSPRGAGSGVRLEVVPERPQWAGRQQQGRVWGDPWRWRQQQQQ